MKRRILLYGTLLMVVLLLTLPWWLPLGQFVPVIEERASRALGLPVEIGSLSASLLPVPQVVMREVRIGVPPLVNVPELKVAPQLSSLWAKTLVIDQVTVRAPRMDSAALALAGATSANQSGEPPPVLVRRVVIEDGTLQFPGMALERLDATVRLAAGHALVDAVISQNAGSARLTVLPADESYQLNLSARDWTLPAGPPLRLITLEASGHTRASRLVIDTLKASLYGGTVSGSAQMRWDKAFGLQGRFQARNLDLEPLLRVVQPGARLGGRLATTGQFSSTAKNAAALSRNLVFAADFRIDQGVLRGVDLAASVKGLFGGNTKPGDTPFDFLKGNVEASPQGTRLRNLEMESGILRAEAEVLVGKDKSLDGDAKVAMKGTASLVSTPELAIGGSTDAPKVYPSKSAMAGAAVGTAVLGPGLGTSLGMKAAELAKKMFKGAGSKAPGKVESQGRR